MPKTEKKIVFRPNKKGGISTYIRTYNVRKGSKEQSDGVIESIKIQHSVNDKYILYDYLRSISPSKFSSFDIYFIISKLKNLNDVEVLVGFINDNIDKMDLLVMCCILNNIPNKSEYYQVIFNDLIKKADISNDILFPMIYSIKDHIKLLSILKKSTKFKSKVNNIFNPVNIINWYYKDINHECIQAAINAFNNTNIALKYLSNDMMLTSKENLDLANLIKYNNITMAKTDSDLYLTSITNLSPSVAAEIFKKRINVDIGLYSSGIFEFVADKLDLSEIYTKVKDIDIINDTNYDMVESGYYLDVNDNFYLITSFVINESNKNYFNFIALPSNLLDSRAKSLMKIDKSSNSEEYIYNKYLVCPK
jgi:hypothetical protein